MKLLIIRHGESEGDILDVHEGRADFELTERGHSQADANNGLIAGLKHNVADEKYPRIDVPVHSSVYEQESMLEFRYRAEYMLSNLLSENDAEDTIAVVSHGGMINQLYRAFLKLPVETEFLFMTGDTGIHEWVIKEKSRIVLRANFIPHNI